MPIPFVKDIDVAYGRVDQLSPLIRRVIANNPGSFTYTGTGVYIIGHGDVAVIDPGPALDDHFDAVKKAVEGERVTHVLVTHAHMDHSPLSHPFAEWAGCSVYAGGPGAASESAVRMEAGDDLTFKPDITIEDGWECSGPGWTIEGIATPGHTANHFCYALREENALFSGDHIMGWSTSIVSPPDGSMSEYLRSLRKVQNRGFSTVYPSHGAPIDHDPNGFIEAYIEHRLTRERAIIAAVADGCSEITDIVKTVYTDISPRLHPAACHSVLAHMIDLCGRQVLTSSDGEAQINSHYALRAPLKSAG
ncbi:MAG: MBL fold metallo-hydrolase [Pseudomonadota bacterium]